MCGRYGEHDQINSSEEKRMKFLTWLAFTRFRRLLLWIYDYLPGKAQEKLGDALYPDDCVISFPENP